MQKLPVISGSELIKYLHRKGFLPARQKANHVFLKRSSDGRRVTVPLHDELDRGTLLAILEQAGISKDEFLEEWRC